MLMSSDCNIVPARSNYQHKHTLSLFNIWTLGQHIWLSVTWHFDGLCAPNQDFAVCSQTQSRARQTQISPKLYGPPKTTKSYLCAACRVCVQYTPIQMQATPYTLIQRFVDSTDLILHVMFVWFGKLRVFGYHLNDTVVFILERKLFSSLRLCVACV